MLNSLFYTPMQCGFFGIDWEFWSGKSSLAVYFSKLIAHDSNAVIITNIKLDPEFFPNYIYFDDTQLLHMFRTDNFVNDLERELNWKPNKKGSLKNRIRSKFIKTYIFFDESNALSNNREWKEFDKAFKYYLNQPRKNFEAIYLIWADGESNEKSFKRFVKWWFYVVPFLNLPILKNIWIIRRRQKDDFWNTKELAYKTKSKEGNIITEYIPVDVYHWWFYKPAVWQYYDDLHKNIPDDWKKKIDYTVLQKYFEIKPHLETEMQIKYPDMYTKYLEIQDKQHEKEKQKQSKIQETYQKEQKEKTKPKKDFQKKEIEKQGIKIESLEEKLQKKYVFNQNKKKK